MDAHQDKANPFAPPQSNLDPEAPVKRPWPDGNVDSDPSFWSRIKEAVPLQPVPFEDPEAFPRLGFRLKETVLQAVGENTDFLVRVPLRHGFAKPWQFLALSLFPSLVLMFIPARFILASHSVGYRWLERTFDAGGLFSLSMLGILFLSPLLICAGMFILGAVTHGCLWLLGGTKAGHGIKQTIRAEGYMLGVFGILQFPWYFLDVVPVLGVLFRFANFAIILVAAIYMGIAVANLHRTDSWRGICAVSMTWFVLFSSGLVAAMALPALLASSSF